MSIVSNINALKRAKVGSAARAPIADGLEEFFEASGTFTNRRINGTTASYQRGYIVDTGEQYEVKTGGIKETLGPGGERTFTYRYPLPGNIDDVIGVLWYVISGKTMQEYGYIVPVIDRGSYIEIEVDVPEIEEQAALIIDSGTLIGKKVSS